MKLTYPISMCTWNLYLLKISCMYLGFQRGITAPPVALGSMLILFLCNPFNKTHAVQKIQLDTSQIPYDRCKIIDTIKTSCHNPQPANLQFFSKKEGLLFSLVDHPAHPIGRGGSNQRELLASPDSPSPCASLATPLFR